jgi:CubicO group peptidase (beta-lactamase class C family)
VDEGALAVLLRAALEFGFAADHPGDDDAAVARLVAQVAGQEPSGGCWSYANAGWCVLGRPIETVSGVTGQRPPSTGAASRWCC